jgi:hypothetical protein
MLAGLGAVAAGTAYYFYGTAGTPKETAQELGSKARGLAAAAEGKAGLRHSQADYQKVYDKIAEMMEKEDHDGEYLLSNIPTSFPTLIGDAISPEKLALCTRVSGG